jgi:uncharacterized protein YjiS (DUF1127 family)
MPNEFVWRSLPLPHDQAGDGIETSRRLELSPMPAINVIATIRSWVARSRERRALKELADMSPHALDDIGLSRDEALCEAARWCWRGERR